MVQTKTNLWRMNTFRCIPMCDHAVCISLLYTASSHTVICFSIPAMFLDRDYFVAFKMCKEIITRLVLLHLQFGPYETDFKYFFPLYWVKKTTISAFTRSLKASFLVKRKQLLCQLLLPFFVSMLQVPTYTSEDVT